MEGESGITINPAILDLKLINKSVELRANCNNTQTGEYLKESRYLISGSYEKIFRFYAKIKKRRLYVIFPEKDNLIEDKDYSIAIKTFCDAETPLEIIGRPTPGQLVEMLNSSLTITSASTYQLWFNTKRDYEVDNKTGTLLLDRTGDPTF